MMSGPFEDDFTIDTQMLMVFGAARAMVATLPPINAGDALILENGDFLLLENGDKLLLETA
jgi:hypothetical protein